MRELRSRQALAAGRWRRQVGTVGAQVIDRLGAGFDPVQVAFKVLVGLETAVQCGIGRVGNCREPPADACQRKRLPEKGKQQPNCDRSFRHNLNLCREPATFAPAV